MNILVSVNGAAALDARIELQRGGRASTCEVTLPPSSRISVGEPLELSLRDGSASRTFRQFAARRVETLGDGRVRAHGSDRREDWNRPIQIDINVPRGDGTGWREGEPISAQTAIERLFRTAGLEAPQLAASAARPLNLRLRGTLARAVDQLTASAGVTLTVDDDGEVVTRDTSIEPTLDAARIIDTSASRTDRRIVIIGGPPIELTTVEGWTPVLPDDDGAHRPLTDVLGEWGISEVAARQACLSDGGFDALLPQTGVNAAQRLATLKRYAFRLFHANDATLPWLPTGGLLEDGTLCPPKLTATISRATGFAPEHPNTEHFETTNAEPLEAFEIDADNGVIYLPQPPYRVSNAQDTTLQNRRLEGDAQLNLTIATALNRAPFTAEFGAGEALSVHAPHLVAVFKDGELANRGALQSAASELAAIQQTSLLIRETTLGGAVEHLALGTVDRVVVQGGHDGLVSKVFESPQSLRATPPSTRLQNFVRAAQPLPSGLHQPINAFRAGPLVIKASGETPEGESVLAAETLARDERTHALELANPGSLAFPFHLRSIDPAKFGRWIFVAGVEVGESGRLRVLAPDERHEEIRPEQFSDVRHELPQGLRGLIVSLGDDPQFVDTGPLISDLRGREPGSASSLIYDIDGSSLSNRKRGGLQFLTAIVLSPGHVSDGARDGGWAPALNLRDGATGNPETPGRGLFAEGSGKSLGRLTATGQGGPILADADKCTKHLYGTASDDGLYRESAGHISTDAFFKIPGDPVHDAPLKFYAESFAGGVPGWPPYEAQLKYDAGEQHSWNRAKREGRWKIQYRVPFFPEIPPTWSPPIDDPPPTDDPPIDDPPEIHVPSMIKLPPQINPAVTDHELWAPSHDWVPAPSNRDNETAVTFPGPSVLSEGWAGETDGVPDPSLGGGCIYLPPGLPMPHAQTDRGGRQTYLALHPEVALAFGFPGHDGNAQGHVRSGWAIQLATSGSHLEVLPKDVDADIEPGLGRGVHVTGHLQLGPDGANFDNSHALRLGENDDEGIAFGDDVALYRNGESTLATDGDLEVAGKLTVEGLIDPTGLELDPQPENPGAIADNTLWISSVDSSLRLGADRVATGEPVTRVIEYTGNGGTKNVILTGINRANMIRAQRYDGTGSGAIEGLPNGETGAVRVHNLATGATNTSWLSLDTGTEQTLTINTDDSSVNASDVTYRLVVVGTPT